MGVITYLLLTTYLPFDSKNENDIIK